MFIVGAVLLCIAIGSCDDIGLNLTNGQTAAYEWGVDTIDSGDDELADDTTLFMDKVRDILWENAGKHSNEVGCSEAGCYIYRNRKTGEERMGKIEYGEVNSNSIYPGSSDPLKNGLNGSDWEVTGYVHTHPEVWCMESGYMRETGPSNEDIAWAKKHGIPVYTIDYKGTYNEDDDKYYIYNDNNHSYTFIFMWVSYPKSE